MYIYIHILCKIQFYMPNSCSLLLKMLNLKTSNSRFYIDSLSLPRNSGIWTSPWYFQFIVHIPLCILLYVTFCEEVVPTGRLSCWKKKHSSLICRMTTGLDDLNWSFLALKSSLQNPRIRSTQTRDTDFLETYEHMRGFYMYQSCITW